MIKIKRKIKVCLCFVVLIAMVLPFQTMEGTAADKKENHSVIADYRYSVEPDVYNASLLNGEYSIQTQEGTLITVVPKEANIRHQLIVRVIPENSDAFSWFKDCFDMADGDICPFDIYYLDIDSNRIRLCEYDKVYISINGEVFKKVYSLSPDETVVELSADNDSGTISFFANCEEYYVLLFEHSYIATVIPPTIESQGYTLYVCKKCGHTYMGDFTPMLPSEIHYIVPCLKGHSTTITFKSDTAEYNITSNDGIFRVDGVQSATYRVYAKQKNSLTVGIGEYNTKLGEVINNDDIWIPLGDVNGDDVIDIADLSMLLATGNYGEINSNIDLTGDNFISIDDIAVALQAQNYGKKSIEIV